MCIHKTSLISNYITPIGDKMSQKSIRKNEGKLRMDLVPTSAIKAMAEVLTKGAEKYDERQWEKGHDWSTPYASLMRHLTAWWEGENKDPESELSHLSHVIMNVAMLIEYEQNYPELDNRPRKDKEDVKVEKYLWTDGKSCDEFYSTKLPKEIMQDSKLRALYEYQSIKLNKDKD